VTSGQARESVDFDDQGSAFERHRGRVLFDMDKHNTMKIACRHLTGFMGMKEKVEKFGLGEFNLKLFRSQKIEVKAENCLQL